MCFEDYLNKHSPKVALQFSGGRDSLAMLLLLQPYWHRLTVYFCNSGDAYPETLALVNAVRAAVPNFVEVLSSSKAVAEQYGWPTDIAQAGASWPHGKEQIKGHVKLNDRYSCCYQTIMKPLHDRMHADGMEVLLRGQRDTDEPKSHVKSGDFIDGFTIVYPIVDWTDNHVETFIRACGFPLPPFYAAGLTSTPDCMHCTAWLEHGAAKYLSVHYPDTARVVNERLKTIKITVQPFIEQLNNAMETFNGMV